MVRSILILGVIAGVLVGAGILHVTYNKDSGSATVSFDKQKAQQAAAKVLGEAKELEANLENQSKSTTK